MENRYNRYNFWTRDCPRNEFLQYTDGVAVTFIPDNDREERAVAEKREEEGGRQGMEDQDPDAVRDQFSEPRRDVVL